MKLGICNPLVSPYASPEFIKILGERSEELGFNSIWVGEHVVLFDDYESRYPIAEDGKMPGEAEENVELEPFSSLAFISAHTRSIKIGTGVCVLPQRNPVYTAKEAANVDWLSSGRLILGIGVGWLAEEFAAVNATFKKRGARCDAYLEIMKTLWQDDVSECENEYYTLPACRFYPKPVQTPHPPLVFGGDSDATFDRIAKFGQGWYALGLSPDQISAKLRKLKSALESQKRNLGDITIYACPYPHEHDMPMLLEYEDLGVDEVILIEFAPSIDELKALLDGLGEKYSKFLK